MEQVRKELGEAAVILSARETDDKMIEVRVGMGGTVELSRSMEIRHPAATIDHERLRAVLAAHGLSPELSDVVQERARRIPRDTVDLQIAEGLEGLLYFDSRMPIEKKFTAFFGATGVGKTTTIAKLAARLKQAFNLRIALISTDSYRVGAGFHLQSYAQLMKLPCRTVNPGERSRRALIRALDEFAEYDMVLIDTAGCSPREHKRIDELAGDFEGLREIERMLMLPAPANQVDLGAAVRSFEPFGIERIVVTKLDESAYMGPVVNTAASIGLPLAFFTTGQRVPEDIEPASARRLGWMLASSIH
jgi:flagellar biosynthesis protein FlhF